MKKIYVLISILLISFIVQNSSIAFAEQSFSVPPMLQNLKGREELVGYFNEIKRIRSNINAIDINTITAKDKAIEIKEQINFYLTQLSALENSMLNFKKQYSNSESDLLFAEQIKLLLDTYKMSLRQQLSLLNALVDNNMDASKLFYSDYLTYIYYYLNLGDQMMAYVNTFYNL